jgi:hypothetical protein
VNQDEVAVEDGVEAAAPDPAATHGNQRSAASRDDIEAFVPPASAARRAELPDLPPRPVPPVDREDVPVVSSPATEMRAFGGSNRSS